jgi:hypothetical protein
MRLQATPNPDSSAISPGYFSTVGQPVIEGRDFNAADDGRNPVVIVNQALAAREWPGQSAIGHRIHTGEIKPKPAAAPSSPASAVASTSHAALHKDAITWATVIGVVGDVRTHDLASAPRPDLYLPAPRIPTISPGSSPTSRETRLPSEKPSVPHSRQNSPKPRSPVTKP